MITLPIALRRLFRVLGRGLVTLLLTILTQVGGLAYLLNFLGYRWIDARLQHPWARRSAKLGTFVGLYLLISLVILPPLAAVFGRVPLPWGTAHHLCPHTRWICLLNRHYVRPALRDLAFAAGDHLAERFPGTTLYYLDANFPLLNGFPLVPHLSHNDGKKLDLGFFYQDPASATPMDGGPSWLGYGIHVASMPDEIDQAAICTEKGYWQYDLLRSFVPQGPKARYDFDAQRTKALVEFLAGQGATGKIFLEPHLKARMGLRSEKIRFHGCQAVRHDDHIHLQLP